MNVSAKQRIVLRPAIASDAELLFDLYVQSNGASFAHFDEPLRSQLLEMQFQAQCQHYASVFPAATDSVIEVCDAAGQHAVGRVIVDENDSRLQLVDISILPQWRSRGLGTEVISSLQTSAQSKQKVVRLTVNRLNPAIRCYEKLGFTTVGENDFFYEMLFQPATEASV